MDIVEVRRKFIAVNPHQEGFRSMVILSRRGKKNKQIDPQVRKTREKIT